MEDKVLLRLPPGPGVFYGDTQGWTELQACTLKITNKIDRGNLWGIGVQKEIYMVKGTPARIGNPRTALFLDNRGPQSGNLVIYRVDKKNEVVTATQSGGLTGALESSDKGTSRVGYGKPQLFPGRAFLLADFGPGVYAIAHLADTCYKFQVGADQPVAAPGAPPAAEVPPAVPEGSEKKKGASAKDEKSNLPKVEKGGSARKQESASKTPKRPPRDTRGSGSHGYTEKQQRALTDFNDM